MPDRNVFSCPSGADGAAALDVLRGLAAACGPRTWTIADEDRFPAAALDTLRDAGVLRAALPAGAGGLG